MTTAVVQKEVVEGTPQPVQRVGILRNSFWSGLEIALNVVCTALLSIAVARVIGPERLGHFVYLSFLTGIANRFADLGTATAARKYIAEYLASKQLGLARNVFFTTLWLQAVLAIIVLLVGILLAAIFVDPPFRLVACILVAAIAPGLLTSVPSQANIAAANYSRNVPGAVAGLVAYAVLTILTLAAGWGLVGLAAAVFLRRAVELIVRLVPAVRWMSSLPKEESSEALYWKLLSFSGYALAISAVVMIVNDRSELVFLKHFCDVKQVAFYSIAFSLSEYLLNVPQMFAGPITAEFMADYAVDRDRAGSRAARALRLLGVMVLPAQLGLAAVSTALIAVAYGRAYLPAVPAVAVVAILAIPKSFFWMPSMVYKAVDRQAIMLRHLIVAAILNLLLDAILIPRFGMMGAAFGNGISQSFAVISMWGIATRLGHLRLQWGTIVRIAGAAIAMSLLVAVLSRLLPAPAGIAVGAAVGVGSYLVLLRLLQALHQEDLNAFAPLVKRMPVPVRTTFVRFLSVVATPRPSRVGVPAVEKA
jgi:O-antigen/teichoic acid export membrane protein